MTFDEMRLTTAQLRDINGNAFPSYIVGQLAAFALATCVHRTSPLIARLLSSECADSESDEEETQEKSEKISRLPHSESESLLEMPPEGESSARRCCPNEFPASPSSLSKQGFEMKCTMTGILRIEPVDSVSNGTS